MALIIWSDTLKTNVTECDEQHKKLITLINTLHDAMKIGKGKVALGKVLTELVDYTQTHFRTEELLFVRHGYAGYAAHKAEHDTLTKQAKDLKANFEKDEGVITLEVMTFLKNWLETHILGTDKKYGPFLNGKGVQ